MHNILLRSGLVITVLFISLLSFAQEKAEMADTMRSNGKIYVVVTVCLIILIGLFLYVWGIDRRVRKMEREQRSEVRD